MSQLRPRLLEGYQQCGRIIYVLVSTGCNTFPLALHCVLIDKDLHSSCLFLSSGVSSGSILVFDVPSKGSNITLSEVLEEHKESITDMASECSGSQVRRVINLQFVHLNFCILVAKESSKIMT